MNIVQKKAKYLGKGKRNIRGIVLHDTFGSGTHNDTKYLAAPSDGRQVSADFTVEKDGTIYQLNPDLPNFYAYHAGRNTRFKGLANGAVNRATIGIEIVQARAAVEYTDAQLKALADLCKYLMQRFGLTPADITTHQKIVTDGSRTDPRNFPFDKFGALLGGASSNIVSGAGNTAVALVVGVLALFF